MNTNSSVPRNSGRKKRMAAVQGVAFRRGTTVMVDNVNIHKTVHQSMVVVLYKRVGYSNVFLNKT